MAGYNDGEVTRLQVDDLLYSGEEHAEEISIKIDTSARDNNNPEGSTILRRGLALGRISANGKYKEFNGAAADGTQTSANVVILSHEVRGIADGDKVATAYFQGTFKESGIIGSGITWTDVQRLRRVPGT